MSHAIARIETRPWEQDRDRLLHRAVCECGAAGPWEMGAPGSSDEPVTLRRNHVRNHMQLGRRYREQAAALIMPPQPAPDPSAGSTTPPVVQNVLGLRREEATIEPISIGPDGLDAALAAAVQLP